MAPPIARLLATKPPAHEIASCLAASIGWPSGADQTSRALRARPGTKSSALEPRRMRAVFSILAVETTEPHPDRNCSEHRPE